MSEPASILVVDDEENLRRTLALILERDGYQVSLAANVGEVRNCLKGGKFDLMLLDLKMPDGNGMTLLPELHSQHPEMLVLILTAHDKMDVAIEAVTHGASDYLLKPVDPFLLLKRVRELLNQGN